MTQIVSFDMNAIQAQRPDVSFQPPTRTDSNFSHAYQHADNQVKTPKQASANDHSANSGDRSHDDTPANPNQQPLSREGTPASQNKQANNNQTANPDGAKPAADKSNGTPQAQTTKDASAAPTKDAPATANKDASQASSTTPQSAGDKVVDPAAAQALLAILLATGTQLTAPAQTGAPQATANALVDAQATAHQPTATAAQTATVKNAPQAQTAQLAALAQLSAQTTATAQTAAPATANAPQPQSAQSVTQPSLIGQAAQSLGLTKVQTTNTLLQGSAIAADLSKAMLKGLEQKTATPGSTTPQTIALDGAAGTGTPSQTVGLLFDQKANQDPAGKQTATPDASGLMAGAPTADKAAGEASKVLAAQAAPKAQEILPQILKYAEQLKANQQSTITLQLNPEHLGSMEIKVMSHQGVLSAQLTADNQNVKALLESHVANLQQSFMDLGLKVDKVQVMLSSANLGFDMSGQMAQQQGQMGSGFQQSNSGFASSQSGYGQWLGEESGSEQAYAPAASLSAINTMA